MKIEDLVRKNIKSLKTYTAARHSHSSGILLDANENNFGSAVNFSGVKLNRYPDPYQTKIRDCISKMIKLPAKNIFAGVGSDEIIDLLVRIFCEPNSDNVIIPEPTYGMYKVVCDINNVKVIQSYLNLDYQLDIDALLKKANKNTKIIFLCSPNNPTGKVLKKKDILILCSSVNSIVVVDEAYIDFAERYSIIKEIKKLNNLVVLRTFSKAWGLAGVRCGYCVANEDVINLLMKIKAPYSISAITEKIILDAIKNIEKKNQFVCEIISEREKIFLQLLKMKNIKKVFPTDANFILFKCNNSKKVLEYFFEKGIIIRDRSSLHTLNDCLRVSVGTPRENKLFLKYLSEAINTK